MRLVVVAGLLLVATLLQSVIGERLPVFGGRPDFVLVIALSWAMLRGSTEGAMVGFLGGVLLDAVSYTPFGVHGAPLGVIGYLVGLAETHVYRGNIALFAGTALVATVIYHTVELLLLQALGSALPPVGMVYDVAFHAAALNAVLLAPTFLLCRLLLRALAGLPTYRI